MKAVDIVAAVLLIALAIVHCLGTLFNAQPGWDVNALWSLSGGMFVALVGGVNLLRVRYGAMAFGLRAVSIVANIILLALTFLLAGALGMAHHVHSVAVIVVVLAATIVSFRPMRPEAKAAAER